jgi:alpha-N-acetylglucosamine transferase
MGLFLELKYLLSIQFYSTYLFANSGKCKKFFNPALLQLMSNKCPLHGNPESGKGGGF